MQFSEITKDLADREFVIFDKEALVVYQTPGLELEKTVIDLADIVSNAIRLEIFRPEETLLDLNGRLVLLRQAGDFFIALLGKKGEDSKYFALDMLKLYSRLLPELT
ncbi:MAG: hypothetical protein GXO69_03175 [Acidobacteria bacterium]|nr:hypothetical protein [Acidobacteriota bacterium]